MYTYLLFTNVLCISLFGLLYQNTIDRWLKPQTFIYRSSGLLSSPGLGCWHGRILAEASLYGLQVGAFSLCPHVVERGQAVVSSSLIRKLITYKGFPGGSVVKICQPIQEMKFRSRLEDPWKREWQPTQVFLPGEAHGQRSLAGYSPWGRKESDMT